MAAVQNLAALAQGHEPVAGAALPVAGGAEGRDVVLLHEPANDLVQRALVGYIKLLGIVGALLLGVAADGGAGAAADLGDAQLQGLLADFLALAGGDDHAGVGHGDPDAGDDLLKQLVAEAVVEGGGVDVVGFFHAGHADGVGANALDRFQMLGVHEQAGKLILVPLQPEQHAQAHVVDAALHGPVHGLGVIGVVVLGSGGMQGLVGLLVIGLLEEDVRADACVLELAVVLHGGGGDVHVDPADGTVLVLHAVNGFQTFQDVLDGVVHGVLTGFDGQALVAHILKRDDLLPDLVLRQLFPGDVLVLEVIGTVDAPVHAVVGQIQGREDHDAVAIEGQLDLFGQAIHLLNLFGDLTGQQHGGLPMGQALAVDAATGGLGAGLFQNGVDESHVVLVFLGIGEGG